MKTLTTKNYNNLPEVQKNKEIADKKEAFKERMRLVKEMESKRLKAIKSSKSISKD